MIELSTVADIHVSDMNLIEQYNNINLYNGVTQLEMVEFIALIFGKHKHFIISMSTDLNFQPNLFSIHKMYDNILGCIFSDKLYIIFKRVNSRISWEDIEFIREIISPIKKLFIDYPKTTVLDTFSMIPFKNNELINIYNYKFLIYLLGLKYPDFIFNISYTNLDDKIIHCMKPSSLVEHSPTRTRVDIIDEYNILKQKYKNTLCIASDIYNIKQLALFLMYSALEIIYNDEEWTVIGKSSFYRSNKHYYIDYESGKEYNKHSTDLSYIEFENDYICYVTLGKIEYYIICNTTDNYGIFALARSLYNKGIYKPKIIKNSNDIKCILEKNTIDDIIDIIRNIEIILSNKNTDIYIYPINDILCDLDVLELFDLLYLLSLTYDSSYTCVNLNDNLELFIIGVNSYENLIIKLKTVMVSIKSPICLINKMDEIEPITNDSVKDMKPYQRKTLILRKTQNQYYYTASLLSLIEHANIKYQLPRDPFTRKIFKASEINAIYRNINNLLFINCNLYPIRAIPFHHNIEDEFIHMYLLHNNKKLTVGYIPIIKDVQISPDKIVELTKNFHDCGMLLHPKYNINNIPAICFNEALEFYGGLTQKTFWNNSKKEIYEELCRELEIYS